MLLSPTQWLNDNIINAAQQLLANNKVEGFQNTQIKQFKPIEPEKSFIQILHVDSTHWITVSNVKCHSNNEVIVYDSRYTGLSLKTKLKVSALMQKHSITQLKFLIANLQQQNDSCSCGLFAITTATELAFGVGDPIMCQWHKPQMRSHLLQSLESKLMTPFPRNDRRTRKKTYLSTIEEEIYCICRQVNDTKRGMVICSICKAWYHLDCMGLEEELIPDNWKCIAH